MKVNESKRSLGLRLFSESEESDNAVLSPEMNATYTSKGSVPKQMQLLRKAIAEETKSISDYEGFIASGDFDPEDRETIQEIANDEKDHIVKWTRLLSKYTDRTYPEFGNESLNKSSGKLKLF